MDINFYFQYLPDEIISNILFQIKDKKSLLSCFYVFPVMRTASFWQQKLKHNIPLLGSSFLAEEAFTKIVRKKTVKQYTRLLEAYRKVVQFYNQERDIGLNPRALMCEPYNVLRSSAVQKSLDRIPLYNEYYENFARISVKREMVTIEVLGTYEFTQETRIWGSTEVKLEDFPSDLCIYYFLYDN